MIKSNVELKIELLDTIIEIKDNLQLSLNRADFTDIWQSIDELRIINNHVLGNNYMLNQYVKELKISISNALNYYCELKRQGFRVHGIYIKDRLEIRNIINHMDENISIQAHIPLANNC